jgi:hydroxymethylpyrimidine/phosphomethylpyrimidine kinase
LARIIASRAKEYKNKVATTKKHKPRASRAGSDDGAVVPCVLAIGGLDPGAGAGILADARAILHAGAFPCAAVSLLTVQSTSGVRSVTPVATKELIAECTEVLKSQSVRALKVGALGSEENAKAIGDLLAIHRDIPSVVDTVMLPTRGSARLLSEKAVTILRDRILKRTTLVTVNAPEAEVLTGRRVTKLDEAKEAARTILGFGPKFVLLKGGHLSGRQAIDVLLFDEDEEIELTADRIKLADPIHGGGCVLASLIAGRLALEADVLKATRWAKKAHHAALSRAKSVGGDMRVLLT